RRSVLSDQIHESSYQRWTRARGSTHVPAKRAGAAPRRQRAFMTAVVAVQQSRSRSATPELRERTLGRRAAERIIASGSKQSGRGTSGTLDTVLRRGVEPRSPV